MGKPIIALDIDDVLSHSVTAIITYSNERWGTTHSLEESVEDLAAFWQVEPEEAEARWQEYMDSGHIGTYAVIPEALATLKELHKSFQIIAVTSRRDVLRDITQEWLNANYAGVIDKLEMAGIYGAGHENPHKLTKAEVLKRIDADFLIDDQPKHCMAAVEVGMKAVLFGDYPWNRDAKLVKEVTRCKDWEAVRDYFDGRG